MRYAQPSQEGTVQRISVQRMSVQRMSVQRISVQHASLWTVRVRGPIGVRGRAASTRWPGAISRPL